MSPAARSGSRVAGGEEQQPASPRVVEANTSRQTPFSPLFPLIRLQRAGKAAPERPRARALPAEPLFREPWPPSSRPRRLGHLGAVESPPNRRK